MKFSPEFIKETRKNLKSNNTKIVSKNILFDMLDEIERLQTDKKELEKENSKMKFLLPELLNESKR